jgi:diguanylate cyclase (GGDEF)-like protein
MASLRAGDTVARLGGDEFLLLISRIKEDKHIEIIANRIFKALKPKIDADTGPIETTTSMGIAIYPQHGKDPDELLKNVDAALYLAKQAGRNNFQYYAANSGSSYSI